MESVAAVLRKSTEEEMLKKYKRGNHRIYILEDIEDFDDLEDWCETQRFSISTPNVYERNKNVIYFKEDKRIKMACEITERGCEFFVSKHEKDKTADIFFEKYSNSYGGGKVVVEDIPLENIELVSIYNDSELLMNMLKDCGVNIKSVSKNKNEIICDIFGVSMKYQKYGEDPYKITIEGTEEELNDIFSILNSMECEYLSGLQTSIKEKVLKDAHTNGWCVDNVEEEGDEIVITVSV